jgi:sec-independent protein translocase protein TatA
MTHLLGLGGIGMPELLVICGMAVLLFGGGKIAEMGKGMGEGIRHFKHALKEADEAKEELNKK